MKRQMLTGSKLGATVLSMILAFHPVFAQAQPPEITVTLFRDLVRFAAPSEVQELRVEVFNSTGERVFDSNFVSSRSQDWVFQNPQGRTVDSGLYAYTITVKDQLGALKQVQQGNVIVDREREGLEAAPPIDLQQARPSENTQPIPIRSWDVDHGKNPYAVNTPAMGIGTNTPLARLHIGAGAIEPATKGSTLLLEEAEATGIVLKSTTGAEMFFSQDRRTGLFGTASNHPLGFRTNNQNRFWITGEGNVGVGTTNPSSPLTVAGVIETTNGGIKFPDGTVQTTAANATSDNSASNSGNLSNGTKQNKAATQNKSTGKRGAGDHTVSPELFVNEDLTVNGNIIFTPPSPQATVRDITMQNNAGGLRLYAAPSVTNPPTAAMIQAFGNGSSLPGQLYLDSGAHDQSAVIIRTAANGSTITERMRVTAAGNVGIGNQSPPETLGVGGRLHVAGRCSGAFPNVQGAYLSWNQLCGTGETDFVNHQGLGPGGFAFMNTSNGTALSTLMFLSGSGNVGISTTGPQAKLDIASGGLHIGGGGVIPNLQGAHVSWNLLTGGTGETDFVNHQGLGSGGFAFMNTPNGTSRSTLMFMSGNGNVGVGTTSPVERVHVAGLGVVRARVESDSNAGMRLALAGNPEWSVASFLSPEFSRPDFQIFSERLGTNALIIDGFSLGMVTGGELATNGIVRPTLDNTYSLGSMVRRWTEVWAMKGSISTSDGRLKQNVTNLQYGLSELMQLRPVTYKWKDRTDDHVYLGLIAQETEKIIPEVIERGADPSVPIGMRYTDLIPVLIKAIQEQQAAIDRRDARLSALESRSADEQKQINALREQHATLEARVTALERTRQSAALVRTLKSSLHGAQQTAHPLRNLGVTTRRVPIRHLADRRSNSAQNITLDAASNRR